MPKRPKTLLFEPKKKVEKKESNVKTSSPVGQIGCKNTKDKNKLLVQCFVNSFRKNAPISTTNLPKLPEMSLFEARKFSKKGIKISKFALQ